MLLFNNTLTNIKLFLMKNHEYVIGEVYALSEDEYGVYVIVGVNPMEMTMNELENKFFSIGFKTIDYTYDKVNKINLIKKFNLMEVSIVNHAAQEVTNARFK